MFIQSFDGAKRAYATLTTLLQFNKALREAFSSGQQLGPATASRPSNEEWKKLDHAVVVSQVYSIYESFIHDCISEWLNTCSKLKPYSDLSTRVKETHRLGIGHILQNLGGRRFSNVSLATLVREYNEAIAGIRPYKLHPDAFLLHDRNLRLQELQEVITGCGLELQISEWLKKHRFTEGHDSLSIIEKSSVEKAITSLIDHRNEASHATREISEILGEDVLIAYIELMESLSAAIMEGFTSVALDLHHHHGDWSKCGKIRSVMTNKSICVAVFQACTLSKGDYIYLQGPYYCRRTQILEIQCQDLPKEQHTVGMMAEEIGLRLSEDCSKNADIYIQTLPLTPPSPIAAIQSDSIAIEVVEEEEQSTEQNENDVDLSGDGLDLV